MVARRSLTHSTVRALGSGDAPNAIPRTTGRPMSHCLKGEEVILYPISPTQPRLTQKDRRHALARAAGTALGVHSPCIARVAATARS